MPYFLANIDLFFVFVIIHIFFFAFFLIFAQIYCLMELQQLYIYYLQSKAVTTDTRTCTFGSMFFALRGERFDGNAYAWQALEAGCSYAVVDDPHLPHLNDPRMLLVDNTLKALQQLAHYHRMQLGIRIIGITGTNGKTTTKELIAAVLSRRFCTHYTHGNLNNAIGVPLTLLQLTAEHEIAVVEMGASHPGDIRELVELVEPDMGIITNVGHAHLQGFGSFEGVIRTKGELYDYLRGRSDTSIFLHADNPHLCSIAEGLPAIRYGRSDSANGPLSVSGEVAACDPFLTFRWHDGASSTPWYTVKTHLVGQYNIDNALCAVTVGRHLDINPEEINLAISCYQPTNSRSQLIQTEHNTLIVDAYNANPTSMRASLDNFRNMKSAPKIVMLGDMKELGIASIDEHSSIIRWLQDCPFDMIWLIGPEFTQAAVLCNDVTRFRLFSSADEVIAAFQENKPEGYTILIKGSNSMHLSTLIPYL